MNSIHTVGKALRQTAWNVLKRLPVFLVAAAACWGLFWLDSYKRTFDGKKAKAIDEVSDDYIDKLGKALTSKKPEKKPDGGASPIISTEEWSGHKLRLNNEVVSDGADNELRGGLKEIVEQVRGRSFESGDALRAALEAAVNARKEESIQRAKADWDRYLEEAAAAETKRTTERNKIEAERIAKRRDRNNRIEAAEKKAAAQLQLVGRLWPSLLEPPNVFRDDIKGGVFYPLMEAVLDKDSGVYVFYQMLWLTFVAIAVLSLIYVVSKVIRALYAAGDAEKFREKAEALISVAKDAPAREASKSAILSVVTLGLATAGVVGAAVVNSKAQRALDTTQHLAGGPARGALMRDPSGAPRIPAAPTTPATPTPSPTPGGGGASDASIEEIRNRLDQIDEALRNAPKVNLGEVQRTLGEIRELIARPQPTPPGFAELTVGMKDYSGGLLKFAGSLNTYSENLGQHAGSLNKFSEGLKDVSTKLGECCQAKAQPLGTGLITGPLAPEPPVTPPATPTPTPHVPEPPATKPKGPGLVSRIFGREQFYRVTPEAYRRLAAALSGVDAYGNQTWADGEAKCILRALQKMSTRPPLGKKKFMTELEGELHYLEAEMKTLASQPPAASGTADPASGDDAAAKTRASTPPPRCLGHKDAAQVLNDWWKIILERTYFGN